MRTEITRRRFIATSTASASILLLTPMQSHAQGLTYIGEFKFISSSGRLLQAYTNGEMHASQDRDHVGSEERWRMFRWPDGKISFENYRSNSWLCAEPNGKAVCDRERAGPWEQWMVYSNTDRTTVSFKSAHGRWLTAQPPGENARPWDQGEVAADRLNVGPWEQFSMVPTIGGPMPNDWWKNAAAVIRTAAELAPILAGL